MNKKVTGKKTISIPKLAHKKLKRLALDLEKNIEDLAALAVWDFLKKNRAS